MKIKSNRYLKPFSHSLGVEVVIPGSNIIAKIFPTKIILKDLDSSAVLTEQYLYLQGPVDKFVVIDDLQSQRVEVSGFSKHGFFRYLIYALDKKVFCYISKSPVECLLESTEFLEVVDEKPRKRETVNWEYLTLGCFKQQDWDMVVRRNDIREILPICLRQCALPEAQRSYGLLSQLALAVENSNRLELENILKCIFRAHYRGIMVPVSEDDFHQGMENSTNLKPSEIMAYMSFLIRRMFFNETSGYIEILPALPVSLHCGKYLNINLLCGNLDLEWSKKQIRRMVFRPRQNLSVKFLFNSKLKSFRLRSSKDKRCELVSTKEDELYFEACEEYYFDNFKK